MAKEEEDDKLPDKDIAKGFYAKYEPKEILGRLVLGVPVYLSIFINNIDFFSQRTIAIIRSAVATIDCCLIAVYFGTQAL